MIKLWLIVLSGLAVLVPGVAMAVPGTLAKGFTVSPAFQDVRIKANQPGVPYVLQLSNNTPADQSFRLNVVDFGALDEQGGVAFLGQPATELEHEYGLASWMKLEKDTVIVPAGKSVQIPVTIENRPTLAPGGHYGAVLATAATDTGRSIDEPRVGIKQVLSSLVLAVKEGGAQQNLMLVSQKSDAGWAHLPTRVEHRFQNVGNVHLIPYGTVEVQDLAGRVVARGALNQESAVVLPETPRRYKTPLVSVGSAWLPGQYRIVTTYRYDGSSATKVLNTSFWYAGGLVVWLIIIFVALAIGGFIWWWRWWRPKRKRK